MDQTVIDCRNSLLVKAQGWQHRTGRMLLTVGALLAAAGVMISAPLIYVASGLAALAAVLIRFPIHRMPGFWLWMLMALGIVLANISNHGRLDKLVSGVVVAWPLVYLYWLAFSLPVVRKWAIRILFVALSATAVLCSLQYFVGLGSNRPFRVSAEGFPYGKPVGFTNNSIRFSFVMMCVAAFLSSYHRQMARGYLAVIGSICSLSLGVISGARGQLLALLSAIPVRFFPQNMRQMALLPVGFVTVAGILLYLFHVKHPGSIERALAFEDGRIPIWQDTLTIIRLNPWLGVGNGGLNDALVFYQQTDVLEPLSRTGSLAQGWLPGHAHNTILSLAVSYGIVTAVLFLAWLGSIVWAIIKKPSADGIYARTAVALVVVFMVGGLTEDLGGLAFARLSFVVLLGWAWSLHSFPDEPPSLTSAEGTDTPPTVVS